MEGMGSMRLRMRVLSKRLPWFPAALWLAAQAPAGRPAMWLVAVRSPALQTIAWTWLVLAKGTSHTFLHNASRDAWLRMAKRRTRRACDCACLNATPGHRWVKGSDCSKIAVLSADRQIGEAKTFTPLALKKQKLERKHAVDKAVAEIWQLVDELDDSLQIKDLYTAMLDPIALRRIMKKHRKELRRQQADVLKGRPEIVLSALEVWPVAASLDDDDDDEPSRAPPSTLDRLFSAIRGRRESRKSHGSVPLDINHAHSVAVLAGPPGTASSTAPTRSAFAAAARQPVAASASAAAGVGLSGAASLGNTNAAGMGRLRSSAAGSVAAPAPIKRVSAPAPAMRVVDSAPLGAPDAPHSRPSGLKHMMHDIRGRIIDVGNALMRRPAGIPAEMVLSVVELECASMHALSIYGDLDSYVDGVPEQTRELAVEKFTGVPRTDMQRAVWRSQVLKPAHYLAVDRAAKKVIVCVRCVLLRPASLPNTSPATDLLMLNVCSFETLHVSPSMLSVCPLLLRMFCVCWQLLQILQASLNETQRPTMRSALHKPSCTQSVGASSNVVANRAPRKAHKAEPHLPQGSKHVRMHARTCCMQWNFCQRRRDHRPGGTSVGV
uniref:Uncharacterized protein n=1 Tax=Chlamydomonas euryale TaxID=1486919 RepID=A0A7R9V5P0_9CHLO|mmetsp:Transcript_21359/g.64014  ORF Transcript_21359/g.64014 Transcript_21359/m.64014 type:complete len:607 (+) Transcript_21359:91-1911(+)